MTNASSLPDVTLRPVTPADDEFLLAVYSSSRAEEVAQVVWPEGQKEAFLRSQFNLQRQDYDSRFPNAEYAVILLGAEPAGRIWIERDAKEIHLLDIAILPEFQNRGIGTLLVRQLINESVRTQKSLRHMVFILNVDAQRFYERLGFVDVEDAGAYKRMEWKAREK
jgi:ribosomal protein S18 acetylase RimI-like enzyme